MKCVIIQEPIAQPDLTPADLSAHWGALRSLAPVDEVVIHTPPRYPTPAETGVLAADADALFGVWVGPDLITADFLHSHPRLRYIATLGHGWEPFDTAMTRACGVTVTNTVYGAQTIAEYAFALLMEVCHHIAAQDARVRALDWSDPANAADYCRAIVPQIELFGLTIGIVGLGGIGFAMARMARGFGMHVIGYSAHRKQGAAYDFVEQVDDLGELLARSDVVSLHLPHTPATDKIIDADAIARMKDGAILINTARGALIDEAALAAALRSGKLRGAGLDVLTEEPPRHGTPLLDAPNLTVTGHIAWLTRASRLRAIDMAIDNFAHYLRGEPCSAIV